MAKPKVSHLQETQKSDQQLGTLLAAVLAHPDTPEKVYNGIVDGLSELQTRDVSNRAQFIQAVIDGHNHQEKLDVTLVSWGNNKIETIKTVKEFTGLSLQKAKNLVDGVPSILKEGVNREEAEAITKQLEEQGCRVSTSAHEKGGAA
jgi:ribosomal protein L7/L12